MCPRDRSVLIFFATHQGLLGDRTGDTVKQTIYGSSFALVTLVETRGIEPLTPALQRWNRVPVRSFSAGDGWSAVSVLDRGDPGGVARLWHGRTRSLNQGEHIQQSGTRPS